MSIYEVIVFFALAGAGGFAYYLYRQDTRPGSSGSEAPERPPGRPMFERTPPSDTPDKK